MKKDKHKVWIELKVNVSAINAEDVPNYLHEISKTFVGKEFARNFEIFLFPVMDEDTDMKLIYDPNGRNRNNQKQLQLARKYMEIAIKEYGAKKI